MADKQCEHCGSMFRPRPQTPGQLYCGDPACQRARRRRWRQEKRQSDADYRDNQRQAQRAWAERHGWYWREWRERHPEYCERNRALQHQRNRRQPDAGDCKERRVNSRAFSVPPGIYRLVPTGDGGIAKSDAWTVEIAVITAPYVKPGVALGELQREYVIGSGAAGG